MEEEIKNTKLAIQNSQLLRLTGFADQIRRFASFKLKKRLSFGEMWALCALIYAGGSMTPTEMGERILRTNDHVSKLVDKMVKNGLVSRYRKGKDRRNVQIKITPSGLDFLTEILAYIKGEEIFLESCLGTGDFQQFIKLLREFRHNLTEKMKDYVKRDL